MKTIELTREAVALVDDAAYEDLSQWKWSLSGDGRNAERRIGPGHKGRIILMHRQLMEAMPGDLIDHINQNPLDNRRSNLRFSNKSLNAINAKKRADNTSGYRGVTFNKQRGKWKATIQVNKKSMHLGFFDDITKAAEAYESARKGALA